VTKGQFSPKGNLYVTIGSSGEGYIWNSQDPNSADFCQKITSLAAPSKLCGVDFHPRVGSIPGNAPNILTGSTTGDLQIWTFLPER
jgi:WD40 repeat protein